MTDERWIGSHQGVVEEITPRGNGRQWELRVGGVWYKTSTTSPVNSLISCGLIGQTVTVYFQNTTNPKNRRVHHIETDMYPCFPGLEQGS